MENLKQNIMMKSILYWLSIIAFLLYSFIAASQNHLPVAMDDFYSINQGDTLVANLLLNDHDPDGDPICIFSFKLLTNIDEGHASIMKNDSQFIYRPVKGFYGNVRYSYIVAEKGKYLNNDTGYFIIRVNRINTRDFDSVSVNNLNAGVSYFGGLFRETYYPHFKAIKSNNIDAAFVANIWIGGYDPAGNLHIAAQTYRQQNSLDYAAGPMSTKYDSVHISNYQRVWKTNKYQIADLIQNYNSPYYRLPEDIKNWPVYGINSNIIASNLAPYVDVNKNSIYDISQGDYHCIYGDEAIFFMFNDDTIHTETESRSMGLDIKAMMYAFNHQNDSALTNTIFVHYEITNNSDTDYHDVYLGMWSDLELGYPYDDYIGCDTNLSLYYIYNGDNNDSFYGMNPPATGVLFLNHQMDKFMYYNNDWSINGNPSYGIEYFYYLSGKFRNGQSLRFGGDGFNDVWQTISINFMYPDDPWLPYPSWSEVTSGNTPSDRRSVGSVGPFDFKTKETIKFDFAFIWARNDSLTYLGNVKLLKEYAKNIKSFYDSNGLTCINPKNLNIKIIEPVGINIFPNPTNNTLMLDGLKCQSISKIEIIDINGKKLGFYEINKNQHQISLDVSYLSKGIYFLKVFSDLGSESYKFIKQ